MSRRRFRTAVERLLPGLLALAAPSIARADVLPIEILARGANRLTADGMLGDWRRFTELLAVDDRAQVLSGQAAWTGPDDASFGFALARDEQSLYFAAEVHDDQLVRSREHGAGDDHLVLSLAVSTGPNRFSSYDIAIWPGEPGSFGGSVQFVGARSGPVPTATVVEAPLRAGGGFSIEVAIPWRSLGDLSAHLETLRGRVAYHDVDTRGRGASDSILATGPGDGQHPAALPPAVGTSGSSQQDMFADFRRSHDLMAVEPLLDRPANLAGDAALERVVIFPGYIFAMGPGIAGGSRYAYVQFPCQSREDVVEPAVRDVTGDGHADIVLRVRQPPDHGLVREVLSVYGAANGADAITRLFAHEVGRSQGANHVADRATFENGPRIRITYADASGWTEHTYPNSVETGVLPPLLPWSENRVEQFRWNDSLQRFELDRAEPNPDAHRTGNAVVTGANPSPTMTTAPADVDAVLAIFRQRNGIAPDARPRFTATGDLSGDRTPETVQIYGRQLVVVGPHYLGGRSFYSIELPATADEDVLSLSLGDVTDDGHADIFVRVRRSQAIQVRGHSLDMVKEYLAIYSADEAHRGRVFSAEVARHVGADAIVNTVQPVPAGRNGALTIDAGRAVGAWTEQTYPFHDMPTQGFAPILLPWDASHRVTYRWNGTALAP